MPYFCYRANVAEEVRQCILKKHVYESIDCGQGTATWFLRARRTDDIRSILLFSVTCGVRPLVLVAVATGPRAQTDAT